MFQFLYVFGPASITYLLVHRILGKDTVPCFNGVVELICYATLNTAITTAALVVSNKTLVASEPLASSGIGNAKYSVFSLAFSMCVAVVIGFVISIIKKRVSFTIEAELRKSEETHESEKDS